ncbi:UNVERIFIED_CONTAM: tRNA 2'-phosphotransferase 1 [Sesamum radiatum]|uniref:2'-phosphotransferase n=1 Tax=Sesamum radiatum TaxID=300843 RepID=A0AAW2KPZ3_SESRA
MEDNRRRSRGRGSGSFWDDKIDALGRLLTRILRHMASELKLEMRSDGYVKVQDVLKLNLMTSANIPLRSHTIEDVREAVRKDNKQRFSLLEENGELLIRANQGHTIAMDPNGASKQGLHFFPSILAIFYVSVGWNPKHENRLSMLVFESELEVETVELLFP